MQVTVATSRFLSFPVRFQDFQIFLSCFLAKPPPARLILTAVKVIKVCILLKKLLISVLGQDQPGILATVSEVIYQHDGNIENLSQTLLQSVFGALVMVSVPDKEDPRELQQALTDAGQSFGLAITVQPAFPDKSFTSSDTQPYIVAAMGPDHQGLVSAISGTLAAHEANIINLQAIYRGENNPRNCMMIFEVDIPRHTVLQDLRDDLKVISERLELDISIQHRGIFDVVSNLTDSKGVSE